MTVADLIKLLVEMPMDAQVCVFEYVEEQGYVKKPADCVASSADGKRVVIYVGELYEE